MLHRTFITDRGQPYTDTPCLILPGILKSSPPIWDNPNLCMPLSLTYDCVRYSYIPKGSNVRKYFIHSASSPVFEYIPTIRANVLKKWVHSNPIKSERFLLNLVGKSTERSTSFFLKQQDQDGVLLATISWSYEVLRCSYAPCAPTAYIGP